MDGVVIRRDEPLDRHTAWRTGGPCAAFVVVHRREALPEALAALRAEGLSIAILGAGTRTVVRDGGVAGAIVRLGTGFASIEPDGDAVDVGAAVPVPALRAWAVARGLSGLERIAAVGSVGASVALDAGWEAVAERVGFTSRGREKTGTVAELREAGRTVITGVRLRLKTEGAVDEAPSGSPWFAIARGVAGRALVREVLERASLAGVRLREALIPEAEPDMLANLGSATARDLQLLHQCAVDRVAAHTGVELSGRMAWIGR
jgi:UDP-N-acetylmuramate dehydrogenase